MATCAIAAANLTVTAAARQQGNSENMTQPRQLEKGDRVIFWRSDRMGPGKRPENENPQYQGTVVSTDPLRVLWDNTGPDHEGPQEEYPIGGDGYERFEIKALPK